MNKNFRKIIKHTCVASLFFCTHILNAYAADQSTSTPAEPPIDRSSNFSLGFDISSYANNFGAGITLGTPHFYQKKLYFQITGDIAWVPGIKKGETETSWFPYGIYKVGLFSGSFIGTTPIRLYGGGGVVLMTPWINFSSSKLELGGYGVTGLDVFFNPHKSRAMFFEFGAIGTSGVADHLVGNLVYANGFTVSWGYKDYF